MPLNKKLLFLELCLSHNGKTVLQMITKVCFEEKNYDSTLHLQFRLVHIKIVFIDIAAI